MQEDALPSLPAEANQHFMEALVDLSQNHEIEVSEDVFAQNGTKLLARGARVDARMYDRIISHKLRRPIETTLVSRDAFDAKELKREAEKQLDESPLLKSFSNWSMGRVTPLGMLEHLKFSPQTSTLLAVANNRNPKNHAHLVSVTLIAMGLTQAARYNDPQLMARIAMAGVLHDIGEVYVDPDFFSSPNEITPQRWQSFASHPIIGAALVREVAGLDSVCQSAILQHHERMDGVGYPRGVSGKAMNPAGNLLAIAEMLAAMINRDCPVHRIDIALKIVPHEFDPALVSLIGAVLEEHQGQSEDMRDSSERTASDIHEVFKRIAATLELRHEWEAHAPFSSATQAAVETVFARIMRVQRAFASTGMDGLESLLPILSEEELREARMEASCVLDEILWRLTRLSRDLALRSLNLPEAESRELTRLACILAGSAPKP